MRIERIEIDGFGRFTDVQWTLGEGLTVLLGANEAGKSTLLNALRALLFGFEPTRDGRAWYPAFAGGRRGGRLVLRTAAGERWTVERHGEKGGAGTLAVRAPNGNQGGQETLNRLLHGADRDLFNNIFAFGLGELQSLGSLSTDGVRGRIYGAGAGLGGTSAVELERQLRQQQEATFLVRGSQKPLNALLARIEVVRAEVAELSRQPAEHESAHRERAELSERVDAVRVAIRGARERASRIESLLRGGPIAAELETVAAELAEGDASLDALPADAATALDRLAADAERARAVVATIDEQLEVERADRAALAPDMAVLGAADEILALRDAAGGWEASVARRRELEAAEARHAAIVADQLARAGVADERALVDLDDSIAAVEATRTHEQRLAAAHAAAISAEESRRSAAEELAARERETGGAGQEPAGGSAERAATFEALDSLRVRRAVAQARVTSMLQMRGQYAWPMALALLLAGLIVGALVDRPLLGALGGGVLGALATLALWRRGGGPGGEITALDVERAGLLARAGLPSDASDAAVQAASLELATARARAAIAEDHRAGLEGRRAELERRERAAAEAAHEQREATEGWEAWLARHGLPTGLSPDGVRQVLAAAGVARRAVHERDEQRALIATIDQDAERFGERLAALLASLGMRPATEAARRGAALAGLVDRLERARTDERRAAELDRSIARHHARREEAGAQLAEREAAVRVHLEALGCPEPELLRQRSAAAAARRELHARERELRTHLGGIAGGPDAVDALVAEVRSAQPAALEAMRAEANDELERLEDEERELNNRIGALEARIKQLEAAEELGQRRQELAVLEGRAAELSRTWSVRAIALKLLEETRSRYERERQPDVVRAAESHFARITEGRYARIVAPPGDASVRVESEGGESKITDELSRGTAEQLYLALRFGLIEEFARQAEPLPVVMDDILVNFDAGRADRAAAAIRDLAERHQVVYFTCHRWAAELLDAAGAVTVSLD